MSERYIAYIDEAGDFGLRALVPVDAKGASEWFVLAAVVIRAENEGNVPGWLHSIRDDARNLQGPSLHFRKLSDRQKRIACGALAALPVRLFVLISNKRNMRGWRNAKAATISKHRHWFYWWCARLLMERITAFCGRRNRKDGQTAGKLRLEFSRRQDLNYGHFKDYATRMWIQAGTERMHLRKREIDWSVFDMDAVTFHDHERRAGLQLADILASAFFQAVNTHPHGACNPDYAKILAPRIWRFATGNALDDGFTVLPSSLRHVPLTDAQRVVFRLYGFPEARL